MQKKKFFFSKKPWLSKKNWVGWAKLKKLSIFYNPVIHIAIEKMELMHKCSQTLVHGARMKEDTKKRNRGRSKSEQSENVKKDSGHEIKQSQGLAAARVYRAEDELPN